MLITDFDFELPAELIAQTALRERAASRMLVVNRTRGKLRDSEFKNFADFIREGDVVVLNNTRVFPARLVGRRANFTGKIELFLVREIARNVWETLARPARRLEPKTKLLFGEPEQLAATVLEKQPDGRVVVEFDSADLHQTLEQIGQTPLPPYIRRDANAQLFAEDRERYQTVYAAKRGAIAAPTAGLHFTPTVLNEVRERSAQTVEITLHVGYGTFEPVRAQDLTTHKVAAEHSEISETAAEIINRAKSNNNRIVAIGTTTTRALENAADANGFVKSGNYLAALTVTPGYNFKTVDALLTNFHLPQSSLLILVATFAGHELTMTAYAHAVKEKYRFYSYGDCMLII